MDQALEIRHLGKRFGAIEAVRDVSLSIQAGTISALIGPNGSGKTTIVKCVVGLLRPSAGDIRVCGHDTVREPIAAKAAIGYIPDDPAVWGSMTGEEFLHFMGAVYGVDQTARRKRIPELLAHFHLEAIKGERFDQYSRGNKQKFSILAALLHRPKLLLIDEPIVGLDPSSARVAKDLFARFAKDGGAILLVTHTLSAAQELAREISLIEHGSIRAQGTLDEMRSKAHLPERSSLENVYDALVA